MIRTLLACVAIAFWLGLPVQAATFTVDNLGDAVDVSIGNGVCDTAAGGCTLRAAIQESNFLPATTDTIILPAGTITLSLSGATEDFSATGDLNPRKNMIIEGAGADKTFIVQTVANESVFRFPLNVPATVEIDGVTISGGNGPGGGGILLQPGGGGLTMNECTVSGNSSPGAGGGIQNSRALILNRCAIIGNTSNVDGGGIANGFSLDATNCTFSNNAANDNGGAILNAAGTTSLKSCTVAGNTCDSGGGNVGDGGGVFAAAAAMVNVQNTIIAGNVDKSGQAPDYFGVFNSQGNNLVGSALGVTQFMGITASNILGVNPLLGPLTTNGGPTKTMALLKGSPAIDKGDCTGLTTDQRGAGFPRPVGAACDIGAFEVQATFQLTTSVTNDNGSIAPPSGPQNPNVVVTLTATPNTGFTVKAWHGTDNDTSTATTNHVTMDADKTVTVEFQQVPATTFQLTTTVVNGNGSLAPPSGPQNANAVVTLTATPDAGFAVKTWQGTDNDASTADTNQVTMNANKTVTVEFQATGGGGGGPTPSGCGAGTCGAGGAATMLPAFIGLGAMKLRSRRHAARR
jgi:hypothetical protein